MYLLFSCSTEPEDSDEDLPLWRQGSVSGSTGVMTGRMSSELKARLDTPVVTPRTMGILSVGSKSANTTPSAPIGHRIVVSNLQTSVTHEDIRVNCLTSTAHIVIHVSEPDKAILANRERKVIYGEEPYICRAHNCIYG